MLLGLLILPKDNAAVLLVSAFESLSKVISRFVTWSEVSGVVSSTHPMRAKRQKKTINALECEKNGKLDKKQLDGTGRFFGCQWFFGCLNRLFHFLFSSFHFRLYGSHLGINGILNICCGISKRAHGTSQPLSQ